MAPPGSSLFFTPSRPAIVIAANPRYGLHSGSGKRTSTRLAFGLVVQGIRQEAERLRAEYASSTGASNPGTSRLYELVVGLVKALIAFACLMIPAMYCRQISDRSAYLLPANTGLPPFQIDWWQCMPEPLSP